MFIGDVAQALEQSGALYCVVGGVAVTLHGVPRMTFDVDIMVDLQKPSLEAAEKALHALNLRCRLPVRLSDAADEELRVSWLSERNLVALTFTDPSDPLREVDVLVNPPVDVGAVVRRAESLSTAGGAIRVASVDDLIAMKQAAGRPQDLSDVQHLLRRKGRP